jgi:hypothetical protein
VRMAEATVSAHAMTFRCISEPPLARAGKIFVSVAAVHVSRQPARGPARFLTPPPLLGEGVGKTVLRPLARVDVGDPPFAGRVPSECRNAKADQKVTSCLF